MADSISITIKGAEYLTKMLADLHPRVQRQVIRPAFKAVAAQMLADAQAAVPVGTGALKSSLVAKVSIGKTAASAKVQTKAENKDAQFYGAFVELGTHRQRPQPYLRPALDASRKAGYRETIAAAIAQEIEKRVSY